MGHGQPYAFSMRAPGRRSSIGEHVTKCAMQRSCGCGEKCARHKREGHASRMTHATCHMAHGPLATRGEDIWAKNTAGMRPAGSRVVARGRSSSSSNGRSE
eukprot:scaffold10373_cov118-Isochrysis_galbana.AAC.8